VRGVVKKAEKQAVRHIDQGHIKGGRKSSSRVSASRREAAEREASGGQKHVNPAQAKIVEQRKQVQHDFGTVARTLAAGDKDDKTLAVEIVRFVQQMPPVRTRHAEQVEALQRSSVQSGQTIDRTPEKGRGEIKDRDR
jgi:hypothetical protein